MNRGVSPINISDVEDFSVAAVDHGVGASELDIDGRPAEIGGHGEISDGCDHGDGGCDVVEDTVSARLGHGKADEGKGRAGHDGGDGPVPVGAMGGDGDVDGLVSVAVDGECHVTHRDKLLSGVGRLVVNAEAGVMLSSRRNVRGEGGRAKKQNMNS